MNKRWLCVFVYLICCSTYFVIGTNLLISIPYDTNIDIIACKLLTVMFLPLLIAVIGILITLKIEDDMNERTILN